MIGIELWEVCKTKIIGRIGVVIRRSCRRGRHDCSHQLGSFFDVIDGIVQSRPSAWVRKDCSSGGRIGRKLYLRTQIS